MKNKSSRRTLPLPDPVYEMLCEEREKQDLYRRMFKGSYNRKYDDYICVDQLGGLIRPNRVTQRFADLIKQYGLRKIRFHDLRHPYVKPTTKKFASFLKFFRAAAIAARSCSIRYSWLMLPFQISPFLKSPA